MSYKKDEHLEWIEIENFKCFDKLKVEGLERVNLIGGENNVGKTAFMEAVFLNWHSQELEQFAKALEHTIMQRDIFNYIKEVKEKFFNRYTEKIDFNNYFKNFNIESNKFISIFKAENINLKKITILKLNNNSYKVENNNILSAVMTKEVSNFIYTNGFLKHRLPIYYSVIQLNRKKPFLNELINYFDSRIEEFDIIDNTPKCFLTPLNDWQDLSELGDGLKRFITIICSIWASKDGTLFIDEIENGIHYTKLPKLWEIIFKTSKEANCQVFATTHSRETIEAFNRVQFELNEENTAYFEFARSIKSGKIRVSKRDKERLEYSLSHGGRFRGE